MAEVEKIADDRAEGTGMTAGRILGTPHAPEIWDACETWSRDRIESHQLERLKAQLAHVARASRHYAKVFAEAGFEPGDLKGLDELRALPLTRKADYLRALGAAPPFGAMLAVDPAEVVRVHFSSGTTAKPSPDCWTAADIARWTDLYARLAYSQGVRRGDVYQCLFNFSWFVGGLGGLMAYQRIGATCIPGGSGDSERQVATMFDYGTTAVTATPSFMAHLGEVARRMGREPRATKLSKIMLGGEPGASIPATRRMLEELWDAKCFDGYGSLEFQPIGWDCAAQQGPHLVEDFAVAEVLDPETGAPVADGTAGVLVLTHLDKQAMPLVRWWTGDMVVRDPARCACGRTHARLAGGVRGRADDMLVIRGVNVFPSAIEELVRALPGSTGEYLIVIDRDVRDPASGFLNGLKLRVEAAAGAPADLGERIAAEVRAKLQVRARVEMVEAGALPRSTHKARRILRED
ncbi:MAG TPA: AMP-binding protein [Thermohalobaculum sp.]|nr:AMP-binding protein [Thermohalobaculum sp.]